jgi:pimeloyl-ACP methyl ester carboxylesterase
VVAESDRIDRWHGFTRRNFVCDGCEAWIVEPKDALPGKPWSWCLEFPDAFTDRCAAPALLARGFHHAHIVVGNTYGSPGAMKHFEAFHAELVKRGLAPTAALIGISRGCLYAHRFAAEHPDKVSVIYGDAGVCDIKSWPGGKGVGKGSPGDWASLQKLYGFADESVAMAWTGGPLDTLARLAKAKIPLIYVVGDADTVVPASENALVVAERYRALGGVVKVIHKPGVDHHPHGLDDPAPVVEFILQAMRPSTKPAPI